MTQSEKRRKLSGDITTELCSRWPTFSAQP